MKWPDKEHNCGMYPLCRKKDACAVLGECLFYHNYLTANHNPQAIIQAHHAKSCGAVANVLRKLKNGTPFKGDPQEAQKHLDSKVFPEIINRPKRRRKESLVGSYLRKQSERQSEERKQYLSTQTLEEFMENRKKDEVIKRLLSEPEPNFHH